MRKLLIALLLVGSAPAAAAAPDDFRALLADHWTWSMRESPVYATMLGVRDHDAEIGDISLAAADRRTREAETLLKRLYAIPAAQLSAADRTNHAILRRMLAESIEANAFGQRMILFSNRGGWHQQTAGMADMLPFRAKADYESYLVRLGKYPALNDEAIRVTERAVREGYMLPCVAMDGFETTISGVIVDDVAKSRFYQPFTRARPADVTDREWSAMQARVRTLIGENLYPAYRKHLAFFTAFVEGWGLYSESLGEEMGKLSYQMWRATRLAVDTGVHAKGWSKQSALDYMKDNTALSEANIEAEVNRYIADPGQELAYKIGELKIRELRDNAEKALGPRFDLRKFHDAVLLQGAVPLDVLETQVEDWIAAEKKRA